jgi:hypothetical protein
MLPALQPVQVIPHTGVLSLEEPPHHTAARAQPPQQQPTTTH